MVEDRILIGMSFISPCTILEIKRLYGDICNGDYYCNETLNFICPIIPGTGEEPIPVTSTDDLNLF